MNIPFLIQFIVIYTKHHQNGALHNIEDQQSGEDLRHFPPSFWDIPGSFDFLEEIVVIWDDF